MGTEENRGRGRGRENEQEKISVPVPPVDTHGQRAPLQYGREVTA
jgi:hypothetical protein